MNKGSMLFFKNIESSIKIKQAILRENSASIIFIYIIKSNKNLDWGITLESVYSNLTLSLIQIKNCSFTSILILYQFCKK